LEIFTFFLQCDGASFINPCHIIVDHIVCLVRGTLG
jgi:hypothetical protein